MSFDLSANRLSSATAALSAPLRCFALLACMATALRASPESDRQFSFAARLMQQGQTPLAVDAFAQFIARYADDPRVPDAHYYLAAIARQNGDSRGAAAHLEAVNNPQNIPADAVHFLRGQVKLETGDAPAAAADLERIDPAKLPDAESRAVWNYLLGAAYRGGDNLEAAAKRFDQASEAESSVRGLALLELGKARILLKQNPAAIEALAMAAADKKIDAAQSAEARALAADLCYQQGLYENAAELYRNIVDAPQATPQHAPAMIGLLRSLFAAGKDEQVVARYEALAKLLPADAHAESLYLLGASQVRLKQYSQATLPLLDFYNRHGSTHRFSGEVTYLYTVCYFHTDPLGFERWFASLEKDLPKMPQRHDLRYLRAQAAVKRGKTQEAAAYLAPLIDEPDSPYAATALLERAALYEQLKQTETAAADYAAYSRRFGNDERAAAAGKRAVDLAFADGQFAKVAELAEPWLKEKHTPAEVNEIRFKLAIARIKLEKPDGALELLDQVLAGKSEEPLKSQANLYKGYVLAGRDKPADQAAAAQSLQAALAGPLPESQQKEVCSALGQLHRVLQKPAESLAAYGQLRKLGGAAGLDELTLLWIGKTHFDRGEFEAALPWLTDLLGRKNAYPDVTAEALHLNAVSLQRLEQWDAAAIGYRKLLAFGKGYGEQGRLGLAQSLAGGSHLEDALDEYDGLINLETSAIAAAALYDSALLRWELASRLAKAGDQAAAAPHREEARKRLSRVVILYDLPQLDPLPVQAMLALGRLLLEMGDKTRALADLQQATARAGATEWATLAKSEAALAGGQQGDAIFLLRKAVEQSTTPAVSQAAKKRLLELGQTP